jgi:hypothetical protein
VKPGSRNDRHGKAARALQLRSHIDARGRRIERLSEYFDFDTDPEKGDKKVTRVELLAVLEAIDRGKRQNTRLRRLWRWLRAPRGSGGVHAVSPTQGEIDRGEVTP